MLIFMYKTMRIIPKEREVEEPPGQLDGDEGEDERGPGGSRNRSTVFNAIWWINC
jgi:hypothetical protein